MQVRIIYRNRDPHTINARDLAVEYGPEGEGPTGRACAQLAAGPDAGRWLVGVWSVGERTLLAHRIQPTRPRWARSY